MNRDKVKKLLAEHNMTQSDLAACVGVTPTMLSKYLLGKYEMRVSAAVKMAKVLDTTVEDLFDGGEKEC